VGIGAILLLMATLYLCDPLNRFAIGMFYEGITGANWKSGLCGMVDLPASASPEDVVNKGYGSLRFPSQILETRKIWIPPDSDTSWAVRLKDGSHDDRIETPAPIF
jgi:hypothetical protein